MASSELFLNISFNFYIISGSQERQTWLNLEHFFDAPEMFDGASEHESQAEQG